MGNEEAKVEKKSNLRIFGNIIFFLTLIILTCWILFKDQDMEKLLSVVKSANIYYILLAIGAMLLYYLIEAYNVKCILKSFEESVSLLKALKFTLIGFFFSSITPAASGGQPMEIYYMTKEKISVANATMALFVHLSGFLMATFTFGVICLIISGGILTGGLIWFYLLGLLINIIAVSFFIICIFSKRLTKKIENIIIKILKFFRVKNIEQKTEKIDEIIKKYADCSIYMKQHRLEYVKAILRAFCQIAIYYTIPFFVYKSFGLEGYNVLQIFTMQAILYEAVSCLPLPGAVGITEAVFLTIYGTVFGPELLDGAMVLNRGISFYCFFIISLIVVIYNAIKIRRK